MPRCKAMFYVREGELKQTDDDEGGKETKERPSTIARTHACTQTRMHTRTGGGSAHHVVGRGVRRDGALYRLQLRHRRRACVVCVHGRGRDSLGPSDRRREFRNVAAPNRRARMRGGSRLGGVWRDGAWSAAHACCVRIDMCTDVRVQTRVRMSAGRVPCVIGNLSSRRSG